MNKWMNKLIETTPIQIKGYDMFVIHGTKCGSSKSRILMLRAMNFLTFLLQWKEWVEWWERDTGQKIEMSFPWKNVHMNPLEILYFKMNVVSSNLHRFWFWQAASCIEWPRKKENKKTKKKFESYKYHQPLLGFREEKKKKKQNSSITFRFQKKKIS